MPNSNGSPLGHDWDPEKFIDYLAAGWHLGDPDAFIEHFYPVLHPQVVSEQPLAPRRIGAAALEDQFRQIFKLLPGCTATIEAWGAGEPNVYVDFELQTPRDRHPLRLRTRDRFTVVDGLITERSVCFDPTLLLLYLIRHPSQWRATLASR